MVSTGSTAVTGMCLGMRFSLVPITEPLLPSVITALRAPLSNIMMTAFSASSIVFTDNPVSSSACNRSYCQWGLSCKVHEMRGGGGGDLMSCMLESTSKLLAKKPSQGQQEFPARHYILTVCMLSIKVECRRMPANSPRGSIFLSLTR